MRVRLRLGFLGTLALCGLPSAVGAQPVGSEFQVNTYTTDDQDYPSVASDGNGKFVVVWSGRGTADSAGIFAQRYDSAGVPLGGEFRVNSYTTGGQTRPFVASDASGNFVVVWESPQDGSSGGIFAQRYDSEGMPKGGEFRVNSYTFNRQSSPAVASDASGNFVVVWDSYQDGYYGYNEVFGQRYDSNGRTLGTEFRVNTYTTGFQSSPVVSADANGDFVVVWISDLGYFYLSTLYGQRFDSGGVAQGGEFRVGTHQTASQLSPSISSNANGNFVVVWENNLPYQGGLGIYGRRFDSEGVPQGKVFPVNSHPGYQQDPSVDSDPSGNFVVVWSSLGQDGSYWDWGIFGQRFDSAGAPQGGEFQVNSYTTYDQERPSVGVTGTDTFVVAWDSDDQDGSFRGVFGQRFEPAGDTITVVSPNTNVRWQIGSLQRIQWTHNLGADATFRIELDRDDDGEYEELIADDAPIDSATKGSFVWTVTGPPSATARVRVSWTDDSAVSDSSDVTFQIRPPG